MNDQIEVSFELLEQTASDITTQASTLESTLDHLKQRIAGPIAQWEGAASGEYQAAQSAWDTSAADVQQVLAAIGAAVQAAAEAFREGEQINAGRWA